MNIHEVTKFKKYAREKWGDEMYMSSICTFPDLDIADTSRYFLPTVFYNGKKSLYHLTIEDVEADDWFEVKDETCGTCKVACGNDHCITKDKNED